MIDRMQVLLLRHRIEPDSLKAMDGKAVFSHAVNNQWIGKDAVVRAALGDIAASGARGTAEVTINGQPTTEVFHFMKEDSEWKVDLAPTIKKFDQALQLAARNQGVTENEFIFSIITSLSGRKVTEDIWTPLQ